MSESGKKASRANLSWKSHINRYFAALRTIVSSQETSIIRTPRPKALSKDSKLIVCDIDDTLTGDQEAAARFNELVQDRKDIIFGIATGRQLADAMETLQSWAIAQPQLLITSVGTEIHTNFGKLTANSEWGRHIQFRWNPQRIREVLGLLPHLRPQEDYAQSRNKISFYCEGADGSTVAEIKSILRRSKLRARVVVSRNYCVDVLPARASKGHALRFVAARWNIDLGCVYTAGDSGNDLDMLRGLVKAIVVGNHSGELESLRGDPNTYFSPMRSAAGILDGLAYYGVASAS